MKTPRTYQLEAIARGVRQSLLIGDKCGLGKTLEAIEIAKHVQAQIGKPVLIVAPSETVKLQWRDALTDQGIPATGILWLDSNTKGWQAELTNETYILTHYEAMRKHAKELSKQYFAVVIADEAHRIKNRKALRTTALKTINAYRKIALTGTPYDKNPADIWSILNWINPSFFTSYWRFFNAHIAFKEVTVKRGTTVKQVLDQPLRDPANFARTLRPFMIERTKEDVRSDLPEKIENWIDLEMGKQQSATYTRIAEAEDPIVDLGNGTETTVSIILTQILRLIQVTTDPSLLGLLGASSVKLDWLADWLEDNPNESVIIFTRFRATAEKLAALYPQLHLIVGGNRAHVDANVKHIVGTIAAMGEGLDLPHIDNAIFLDVEWSSILMQQAIDRIHRINITNAKNLYYLRCVGTVDALLHRAIRNKWSTKQIAEEYLNGKKGAKNAVLSDRVDLC